MTLPSRGHRGASDPAVGISGAEHPGAVFAGKFQLLDLLGRGGMGSVWRAQDLMLGRPVAIKFIRPVRELDEEGAQEARVRFEREARAAAQLRTRHVVQIYEYGFHGDIPYIVMEMLAGETLGQRMERLGRLPPPALARILDQAAKALELAHAAGIIHRDLKPANIFLAREDNEEIVKILDFGVAKATGMDADGDNTATGRLVGSPYYMSPEQARGEKNLDGRSDLWSMAVILFRALTGHKAFSGDSIGAVMVQILRDPIPLPSRYLPELPGPIDKFFERALARDPARRFQTAGEMARAFGAVAAGISGSRWPAPPQAVTTSGDSWARRSGPSNPPARTPVPGDAVLTLSGSAVQPLSETAATRIEPAMMVVPPPPTPSASPLSLTSQGTPGPGMTFGGSGTLTHLPFSPPVRRALWAAAGFGVAIAVVGLVLIARVAFSDPPASVEAVTTPDERPAAAGAQPAPPSTAVSAAPSAAAPPADTSSTAVGGATPGASAGAEPAASASPSPPPTAPAKPPPPKRKPKWY